MNMVINKQERTTISLNKENYEILKQLGHTGESFNTVLSRVLKQIKKSSK